MIKTIFFDWGGVLIDNPVEALNEYCAFSVGVSVSQWVDFFAENEADLQTGKISMDEFSLRIKNKFSLNFTPHRDTWKDAIENAFYEKKESFNLIEKLKDRGYHLGLLSNTEEPTVSIYSEREYEKYFQTAIFSCVEKVRKPDKGIYEKALEASCSLPEETVFIDDRQENIEAAIALGIKGILYTTFAEVEKRLFEVGVLY